jgi:hypothetical protein
MYTKHTVTQLSRSKSVYTSCSATDVESFCRRLLPANTTSTSTTHPCHQLPTSQSLHTTSLDKHGDLYLALWLLRMKSAVLSVWQWLLHASSPSSSYSALVMVKWISMARPDMFCSRLTSRWHAQVSQLSSSGIQSLESGDRYVIYAQFQTVQF